MNLMERIQSIFPEKKNIPEEFFLETSVDQDEYLLNVKLIDSIQTKKW